MPFEETRKHVSKKTRRQESIVKLSRRRNFPQIKTGPQKSIALVAQAVLFEDQISRKR
jgi:hypothetical protein